MLTIIPRFLWYTILIPGAHMLAGSLALGEKVWDAERTTARTQGTVVQNNNGGSLGLDFSTEVKFPDPDGSESFFRTQTSAAKAWSGRP